MQYHDGKVFTWTDGRKLATVTDGSNVYEYTYDSNGNRIKKKVNGATTQYIMSDGLMLGQNGPGGYLFYFFDESGRKYGFILNSSQRYYYEYNLQGDVIGIYDSSGNKVVTYTYDAWGKLLDISGSAADTVGVINPIRYRGYYYDAETGYYFLQTRYYDPNTGRFLNADGYVSTGQGLIGNNMFAYCGNSPVINSDPTGERHIEQGGGGGAPVYGVHVSPNGTVTLTPRSSYTTWTPQVPQINVSPGAIITTVIGIELARRETRYIRNRDARARAQEREATATPPPSSETIIYRYYASKNDNLSPRVGRDYDGVSFRTTPPPPGTRAVVTTVEAINSTGIIRTTPIIGGHLTVVPVNATVKQWMATGDASIWTQTLSSVVAEWDGG